MKKDRNSVKEVQCQWCQIAGSKRKGKESIIKRGSRKNNSNSAPDTLLITMHIKPTASTKGRRLPSEI